VPPEAARLSRHHRTRRGDHGDAKG